MVRDEGKVTVREFYQALDDRAKEFNVAVGALTIEISNLKAEIANMKGRWMMIPVLISIAMAVFSFMINYVITHTR